jgi:ribosomal protein S18 acetylase RimI-like enzyme
MSLGKNEITYRKCSEVEDRQIHQAFSDGFSDYIIKMEIPYEDFVKRFFGPEGNSRKFSFIAFDGDKPVGVILGGIKTYESIKTMRCGTLAISSGYRGKRISQQLFELHKEAAIEQGCKQLFLEVIVGNDRAINFYKRLGYEKVYDIVFYSTANLSNQLLKEKINVDVRKVDFHGFKAAAEKWDYHINWQNDLEFVAEIPTINYFAAYENGRVTGSLAISPGGNIHFLMVDKPHRGQGVATSLLHTAVNELQLTKLATGFPNNHLLEGFFKKHGFEKGSLAQYEMYLSL